MNKPWLDILSMEEKQEAAMVKRLFLCGLIFSALLSLWKAAGTIREEPVKARFATVQRGDVHQVVAITGRLAFAEEEYILAPASGVIRRICVEAGQRIEEGGLLTCMDSTSRDDDVLAMYDVMSEPALETLSGNVETVLRSQKNCTVREILLKEGATVTAGTPIMRTTSGQQQIVCSVSLPDVTGIHMGMWAWISSGGEALGTAIIREISMEQAERSAELETYKVILLPEGHIDLPEGAAVDVDVYFAGSDDVLCLPLEAVTDRETVWWVHEGRCTEIPAKIVLNDEMRAWVDLPEGLTVAVGEFTEGQRVSEAAQGEG